MRLPLTTALALLLPIAGCQEQAAPSPNLVAEPLVVTVKSGGGLLVGGKPSSLDTLRQDLVREIGPPSPTSRLVVITAPDDARYGDFIAVVSIIQESGYRMPQALIQER
jgi:biopolymer transport protein ExbD